MNKTSTDKNSENEVWFVYDGECPICKAVAQAYKIKKALGTCIFWMLAKKKIIRL